MVGNKVKSLMQKWFIYGRNGSFFILVDTMCVLFSNNGILLSCWHRYNALGHWYCVLCRYLYSPVLFIVDCVTYCFIVFVLSIHLPVGYN